MRIFNRFFLVVGFILCLASIFQMMGYVAASPAHRAVWAADSQSDLLMGRQPKVPWIFFRLIAGAILLTATVIVSAQTNDRWFLGDRE